jgi:hypothetical protein
MSMLSIDLHQRIFAKSAKPVRIDSSDSLSISHLFNELLQVVFFLYHMSGSSWKMSESPPRVQSANNAFAAALSAIMHDPKYSSCVTLVTQISQLLIRIDSEVPGATDALLRAILAKYSAVQ